MEYKDESCASGGGGKISVKDDRSFKAVGNPRQEKTNSIVFEHYFHAILLLCSLLNSSHFS